jgi:hypothetical protein
MLNKIITCYYYTALFAGDRNVKLMVSEKHSIEVEYGSFSETTCCSTLVQQYSI